MKNYRHILKNVAIGAALLVAYFFAGKLGLSLAFVNESASAVWPPTGIALAALLILGFRFWPAIFLGAFLVNLTTSGDIPTSLGIAFGNTAEGVVGVYLINRYASGREVFSKPLNIFKFVLFVGIVAPAISASIGVSVLVLGGLAELNQYHAIWFTWWLGDMGGALVVTPFLILWVVETFNRFKPLKVLEAAVVLFILLVVSQAVFSDLSVFGIQNYPVAFLTFPVILWVALRFGRKESATAIIVLATLAVHGTLQGFGPFSRPSSNESLLLLQAFTIIMSIVSLALSSAIWEGKKLEGRFRGLIENSSDAITLIDLQTNVLYTSPSTLRVLGFSPEEFVGMNGLSLVDPADKERISHLLKDLVSSQGKVLDLETRIRRKDGKWIWVEAVLTNLLHEPAVGALVVNYRDISENKRSQGELVAFAQRLAEEKAKAEVLLASIGEGIVATDNEGRIILVNKAFEDLFGWQASEVTGKQLTQLISMEEEVGKPVLESDRPMRLALASGKKITGNFYLSKKNKSKFPASITATPLLLNDKIIGGIKVVRDITVEKQIDKAKTEFVSLASHQLRTPLTIMKWQSSQLVNELEEAEEKLDFKNYHKRAQNVYTTNERMIELVNAILNISKIELGTLAVEPVEISLQEIVDGILEEMEEEIQMKKFKLRKSYPTGSTKSLLDPRLVRIVFQNLLTNAIKYTPPKGQISIKIETVKDEVLFTITDTGVGILPEDQDKIFNKFFRTEAARQIDPNGNGLGMYVVKAIVNEVKGKIWFESKVDKGTTFYVKLPLRMKARTGAKDLNESFV